MDFGGYGNHFVNDGITWQEEESAGQNDDFSEYIFNDRGGFRRGGGYGMHPPRFFGERGPSGFSGPRFMWGRGFGPAGPPMQQRFPKENNPMSFLIRCGVLKQNLKGLPRVLLRLMEPQYCGVCAQGFDNFDGSRLHYISKNHTKNQKKWLAQQAEVGSHRPREIPLKSRDLYCELCDVHITSKTHADSHYAGRPHRGSNIMVNEVTNRIKEAVLRSMKLSIALQKPTNIIDNEDVNCIIKVLENVVK